MEVVDAWDRKFSPLHQMVAPAEPPRISGTRSVPNSVWWDLSRSLLQSLSLSLKNPAVEPTEPDDVMMAKLLEPQEPAIAQQSSRHPQRLNFRRISLSQPRLPSIVRPSRLFRHQFPKSFRSQLPAPPNVVPLAGRKSGPQTFGWFMTAVAASLAAVIAAGLSARTAAGEIAGQAADPGG